MSRQPRIYTRTGDDGTTGLLFGGRAPKTDPRVVANGDIDEAQAAIGVARAAALDIDDGGELHRLLTGLARDLWRLMGEVAVAPENREKLGASGVVTQDMVDGLEHAIDDLKDRFAMPTEFVVPGANAVAAALDVARAVVRRAERSAVAVSDPDSLVTPYLNRLSDLLWAAARAHEGTTETARAQEDQP
jgi:cob(I)alamin adenosyltransferase